MRNVEYLSRHTLDANKTRIIDTGEHEKLRAPAEEKRSIDYDIYKAHRQNLNQLSQLTDEEGNHCSANRNAAK